MAQGDNYEVGSSELTQEDFDAYESMDGDILQEISKVVKARDEAKAFLDTEFGQSIRKLLRAQKLQAMMGCADADDGDTHRQAKQAYDTICGVERIFSIIIVDGDEALTQIKQLLGDDDGN